MKKRMYSQAPSRRLGVRESASDASHPLKYSIGRERHFTILVNGKREARSSGAE
jgi:hypothetical protein